MINAVICPLSPFDPNSEPDEDVGWADMSESPIQAEGRSAVAAAGDVVDDVVDCEEDVEVQVPRGMPQPSQPSPQEVARHNLTHWPYRS